MGDDQHRTVQSRSVVSSQETLSASRWFVGSSSSSISGFSSSRLHSATRRRSPPERC